MYKIKNLIPNTRYIIMGILILIILSCDFFNAPVNNQFLKTLNDEIEWANAKRLAVTVAFPEDWGFCPQRGLGKLHDG